MKRRIHHLRWRKGLYWELFCGDVGLVHGLTKAEAERKARAYCRLMSERHGVPIQLLIHRKDGTIAKGGRSEASYGCDSRRRRG